MQWWRGIRGQCEWCKNLSPHFPSFREELAVNPGSVVCSFRLSHEPNVSPKQINPGERREPNPFAEKRERTGHPPLALGRELGGFPGNRSSQRENLFPDCWLKER